MQFNGRMIGFIDSLVSWRVILICVPSVTYNTFLFLQTLTKKYFETKFAKINVDKAKYFVEKLKIRVLPAVLCFKNGMVVDR
jgi:hypothetical protein